MPEKAYPGDACYDVYANSEPNIVGKKASLPAGSPEAWERIDYIEYDTGLCIAPESETENQILGLSFCKRPKCVKNVEFEITSVEYHINALARSSVTLKNLILKNCVGVIDNKYRNSVKARFAYTFQPEDFLVVPQMGGTRIYGMVNTSMIYNRGDRIIQIKAEKNIDINCITVEELPPSERGLGGFGSSGNK